ncbi:MAG: UDP-3-O-(3-hydroxymyristoyl)glucosamine N-acyltransferase [Acidobacteria bacterium]|nr:UDP-3-O-(3-hydroxymyristoyl)glucosamine N-acyltransferase [Acidobacteriota bacterium]
MKLSELAERLGCRLEGDGDAEILGVAGIDRAGPSDVTFFVNPRYSSALRTTRAAAVILNDGAPAAPCAMLRTAEPYVAFADAVAVFADTTRPAPGIHVHAAIGADVDIDASVSIAAFVSIGDRVRIGPRTIIHPNVTIGHGARIGADCLIHSNVAIRERTAIGHRVVLQNGAAVGADGFGFAKRPDGTYQKIPQAGVVVIEDDVEIGANTTIDRPAVGETRIRAGAKIDNLVQVAHGVSIGRNALLAAQVGIAGSTELEDDVVLAGQVGVAGHLKIGRGTVATAQSGIPNSVPAGALVSGFPAIENREWLKASAIFRRLPELKKSVAALERRLTELEERLSRRIGV